MKTTVSQNKADAKQKLQVKPESLKSTQKKNQAKPVVKTAKPKKKVLKHVAKGKVFVSSSYNNTLISITDEDGNVIASGSAGSCGFKGSRRGTPYAATIAAKHAVEKAKEFGFREADVLVKGIGSGRESAVRAIHANGIEVNSIKDLTPIPHGGCRPKKVRRV